MDTPHFFPTSFLLVGFCCLIATGCSPQREDTGPDCSEDSDGDGLDDCEEIDLGLDPNSDDSDSDGFSDSEELDCVSDPLDGEEVCYACGWQHNDPGTYESNGNAIGDTAANSVLVDQCGELVDLWDFTGKYYLFYLTAAW